MKKLRRLKTGFNKFDDTSLFITASPNNQDVMLVLGFDCQENVFVISKREYYTEGGKHGNRARIEKRTIAEISYYLNSNVRYEICTNCGGQPERTHTSLYTGWTNWEQQNFNIYTRKFVTNKVVKEHTSCKECEGGWKKK